jgi:hypothetical protein
MAKAPSPSICVKGIYISLEFLILLLIYFDSIVALLDLADEQLGCDGLVIVLERSSPHLATILHSLMYVGGTVVTKPLFPVDPAYVLVGLEI